MNEEIEEVNEFIYLGYCMRKNGSEKGQIRELARKGNVVMRQVWGLGERRMRGDFKRRMMLFDYLIRSVIMYGAEVWGWKECERLESV